jgi:1,4-alpha-glucan branching enzyme
MSTIKKYLKTKPVCKVTFKIPSTCVENAEKVALVGEFNNWNKEAVLMDKLKDGSFKATVDLEVGKAYAYRYLIDNKIWENDWDADKYENNGISAEDNSIVLV